MNVVENRLYTFLKSHKGNFFEGGHDIHTPRELVENILSQIPDVNDNKTILVLFNVEFIISLVYTYKVNTGNITFYSDHENKTKMAQRMGVKVITTLETNMKFDVIVGNPPYQSNNDKGTNQPKSHNLWSKFVDKAFGLALNDGYISFVTPDSWMSPNSKVLKEFKENSMIWVDTDVSKYFTVGSSFTAWVVQKNKKTPWVNIDNLKVNLSTLNYLPRNFSNTYPIHNKVINSSLPKIDVLCDTTCHSDYKHGKLSKTQDKTFKYKTYHTNAQIRYSKIKSKDFDKQKIVWTLSGYFKPFYDDGTLGTTEVCQYILVSNQKEAENILSYLDSKLYKFIITTGKWSGFLNGKVLASVPKLQNKKWSDEELYQHFGLTQEEIDYIEANVK